MKSLTFSLLAATVSTHTAHADQDQPAYSCHQIIVYTVRYPVSTYFEIFPKIERKASPLTIFGGIFLYRIEQLTIPNSKHGKYMHVKYLVTRKLDPWPSRGH
jgi:hypothetical protein